MKPVLPPTFVSELDSNRNRISNMERNQIAKETEPYLLNKPATVTFIKYSRDNSSYNPTYGFFKADRIQSQWVKFPFPIKIYSVYVTHKTEHVDTTSFQDFYRCSIATKTNDLEPQTVLSEFNVSLNRFDNRRSNQVAGLWQDSPFENEAPPNERYFQYKKDLQIEIRLPEPVTIKADQRFSLIKIPVFAKTQTFLQSGAYNLDIDVMVFKGYATEPVNVTVQSTLIKKFIPTPVDPPNGE